MINLNKNHSLDELRGVIRKSIYERINVDEQKKVLELFNQRVFLEETIDKSISFNKKLNWDESNTNYQLTTTAEELIEVFKLRSNVFTEINYQEEFPDTIEGLNFDKFDHNSAIIYCAKDGEFTGTSRIIFDSKDKLPTDSKFSFNYLREKNLSLCETSRFTIKKDTGGLSLDFKNIMRAYYEITTNNNLDLVVSGIKEEHYKMYSKFGGMNIEKELDAYGEIELPCLVISWNPYIASKFFKRSFLR
ncbi:N-acyl amino acid synthase FeeM domain-containing protein [Sulfurospirillum arcachonense]|uniref:N-acyl amino acid synthase FeeM domain-containing protein n=1 Tax=Sulfurospirillum arcachonense TaxID=57666 RepID=UPI000468A389|nr:GNAT family N-acyltransferase [Sulfurospirillum arcachonense]